MPILNCPEGKNKYVSDEKLCKFLTDQYVWSKDVIIWMTYAHGRIKALEEAIKDCCDDKFEVTAVIDKNKPPEEAPEFPPP